MTGTSPAGPFRCGSTTWSTKPAATAASNALPPLSNTAMPADDASQCVDATMPNVPVSSGRVVNTTTTLLQGDNVVTLRDYVTRRTHEWSTCEGQPGEGVFRTGNV